MITANKRRCSGSALPGEHEQQRRRARRPSSLCLPPTPPPSSTNIKQKNTYINHHADADDEREEEEEDDIDDEVDQQSLRKKMLRKNVCSWSSTSSCFSAASSLTSVSTPVTIAVEQDILLEMTPDDEDDDASEDEHKTHQRQWRRRVSRSLSRSASNGDAATVRQILTDERLRPFLVIDASDDDRDGTTPLIYAACFGKADVVRLLLEAGAQVDVQDKRGWTALMWATINNHSDVVAILLEHGACSKARSRQGRTVMDLVDTENEQLIHILDTTTDNEVDAEKKRIRRKSLRELHLQTTSDYDQSTQQETKSHNDPTDAYEKELINCEASIRSIHKFAWDRCLPDQMFVFSEENIDHILDTTITRLTLPMKSRQEIYVPANVLFLSVRFAHYYSSKELLNAFLNSALQRISDVLKANTDDIHTLAFWTSNLSQLLYYFKKDTGLVVATAEHQLEMSELICETYTLIVADSARRIDKILEQSMLEHEPFQEQVSFADDYWPRLFRRRPTSISTAAELTSPTSPCSPRLMSPRSVTSLLGSILYVLQSYEVHPAIILQAVAQFCHFLSCEMFNRILTSKRYLCRSKALQIRMNLSVIEEWMRDSQLPSNLTSYFNSLVQLLQLLQCVSGLNELMLFVNTVRTFDLLNPLQIRRCVLSYRYEVNEPKLPEEVEKYALQIAQDTVRPRRESVRNSFSASATPSSRPTSVSSLGSLLMSSMTRVGRNSSNPPPQPPAEEVEPAEDEAMEEEEDPDCLREWTVEKRDSRYMLPFSLPATWSQKKPAASVAAAAQDNDVQGEKDSVSEAMCQEYKQKLCAQRDLHTRDCAIVPTISEDWLDRLDSKLES